MLHVQYAIQTFLSSQINHTNINEPLSEPRHQSARSNASLLYTMDRASYCGSVISFSISRDLLDSAASCNISPSKSGDLCAASSLRSSLTVALLPASFMESIHIPPSLLRSGGISEEQYWFDQAPTLLTQSPAPYSTFKERYFSIYPYL